MINQDIIVLAYPHSSAYYWLLSAELNKFSLKEKFSKSHPYFDMYGGYFRTLFGKNPAKLIDEVVSLSLLYKNIYLSPCDIDMPKAHRWSLRWTMKYEDNEIGVKFDWKWRADSEDYFQEIPKLLENDLIKNTLKKIQVEDTEQFLQDCITQIYIADTFKASIIGGTDTLKILQKTNEIISIQKPYIQSGIPKLHVWGINSTFNLASLHLKIGKLDEYISLRTNETIIKYSQTFKTYLNSLPQGDLDDGYLYRAMLEAIETESLANKISGGLDISGTILNVAGLIPFVGSVTGIVGLVADASEKGSNKVAEKNSWWTLAPEISKQLTKFRIEEKVRTDGKGK